MAVGKGGGVGSGRGVALAMVSGVAGGGEDGEGVRATVAVTVGMEVTATGVIVDVRGVAWHALSVTVISNMNSLIFIQFLVP